MQTHLPVGLTNPQLVKHGCARCHRANLKPGKLFEDKTKLVGDKILDAISMKAQCLLPAQINRTLLQCS